MHFKKKKNAYFPPQRGHPGPPSAGMREVSINLREVDCSGPDLKNIAAINYVCKVILGPPPQTGVDKPQRLRFLFQFLKCAN